MSVEKLVITKEAIPYTTLPNNVLQGLKNIAALGLWVYLQSLPPNWEIYKNQLRDHFNIGINKLDYLFSVLKAHNLLSVIPIRNAQGKFAHFSVHIHDGTQFVHNPIISKNKCLDKSALHSMKTMPMDSMPMENSTYKYNKEKNNNKKLLSASGDPQNRFDEFWKEYPVKKNKKRSQMLWARKNLDSMADKLIADIQNRKKNDPQWQKKEFIPHAATYLLGERWEDEIMIYDVKTRNISHSKTETRSTVPEWGVGHPTYDALYKNKDVLNEKPTNLSRNNAWS